MQSIGALAKWVLTLSVVAICGLTYVWPFAISADPAQPAFKIAAITAFAAFLVSLAVVLAARLARMR